MRQLIRLILTVVYLLTNQPVLIPFVEYPRFSIESFSKDLQKDYDRFIKKKTGNTEKVGSIIKVTETRPDGTTVATTADGNIPTKTTASTSSKTVASDTSDTTTPATTAPGSDTTTTTSSDTKTPGSDTTSPDSDSTTPDSDSTTPDTTTPDTIPTTTTPVPDVGYEEPVPPGDAILIDGGYYRIEETFEPIPYEKVLIEDANLPTGTSVIETKGVEGQRRVILRVYYDTNGNKIQNVVVKNDEIVVQPVDEVARIGTKPAAQVSPNNVPSGNIYRMQLEGTTPSSNPAPVME